MSKGVIEKLKIALISLAVSSGIVFVMQLMLGIYYSTDDDYAMASTAFNYHTTDIGEHLVFINGIIGKILRILYGITSSIHWYSWLMVFFFVVSFAILFYVFWNLRESIIGLLPIAFIEILIINYYSFTVVAYLLTITAFVFGTYYLKSDSNKTILKSIFASGVFLGLLLLGFMYRPRAFYSALPLLVPLAIYCKNKINIKVISVVVLGVLLILGTQFVNNSIQSSNNNWKEYYSYLESRNIIDEGKVDYNKHKKEIEKLGLSKNDIDCFYAWTYADKKVYSEKKLNKLASLIDSSEKYLFDIKEIAMTMLKTVSNWIILLIGALGIFVSNKRGKVYIIFSALIIYGLTLMLVIRQRFITRVYLPICLVGIVILLFFIIDNYRKGRKKIEFAFTFILAICAGVLGYKKYTG